MTGVMAKARDENFRVASRLLRPNTRRHLLALYGFARLVDDTGDERPGDPLELLDGIEADVDRLYRGEPPADPLVRNLAATVTACAIPAAPLKALIEANRRDQRQHTYASFEDLLSYCALSANPVGELVLRVFGRATPERLALSNEVCTGLQLTEHWQDVAEDLARGRVYLPAEDLERFACTRTDLAAHRANDRVRALVAFEVARTRALMTRGARLVSTLHGAPAVAVAGFIAGGRAALTAIERSGYDVLSGPPRATGRTRLMYLATTLVQAHRRHAA